MGWLAGQFVGSTPSNSRSKNNCAVIVGFGPNPPRTDGQGMSALPGGSDVNLFGNRERVTTSMSAFRGLQSWRYYVLGHSH